MLLPEPFIDQPRRRLVARIGDRIPGIGLNLVTK